MASTEVPVAEFKDLFLNLRAPSRPLSCPRWSRSFRRSPRLSPGMSALPSCPTGVVALGSIGWCCLALSPIPLRTWHGFRGLRTPVSASRLRRIGWHRGKHGPIDDPARWLLSCRPHWLALAGVKNEAFDAAIGAFGEVVKPTQPQNIRGQKVMNGNRYCVVDPGDKTIPGTIKVLDINTQKMVLVHLRYKGQQWWCRRCDANHIGPCEYLKKFYAARDARKAEQIRMKVVSDSTLCLAETVSLRADVLCMSGGGVGHLGNAVRDDPAMPEMGVVAVITGGNDYIGAKYENNNDFVFTVDKSVEKLKGIFGATPDKSFTVLYPQDDASERALPPDLALWGRYLQRELRSLASPTVAVVPIPVHEVDTDGHGHPTVEGTMTILKGLDERLSEDLFFRAKLATSRRPYAGVQEVYRFGCRTCAAKGERYTAPLEICCSCRTEMAAYDGASKWDIFVASVVNPPGGPPSPSGVGSLPDGGYPEFSPGIQCAVAAKRDLDISLDVTPALKQAVTADTAPSTDDHTD